MSQTFLLLWLATAGPHPACDVDLGGDPELVGAVRTRLDLALEDGVSCSPIAFTLEREGQAVVVTIVQAGRTADRRLASVDMASVLIESRLFMPVEASVGPKLGSAPASVIEPEPEPEPEAEPAPPRRVVRPIVENEVPYERVLLEEGPQYRIDSAGEVSITDDGSVWYGPSVETALSDGKWTAGAVLRYAQTFAAVGQGFFTEIQPMLGRDFTWSWGSFEPRVGFSIRWMRRSVSAPWLSPCGQITCPTTTGFEVQVPTTHSRSLGMTVGARATFVVDLSDEISVVASAGIGTAVAVREEFDEVANDTHRMAAGRFALGGRLRL